MERERERKRKGKKYGEKNEKSHGEWGKEVKKKSRDDSKK